MKSAKTIKISHIKVTNPHYGGSDSTFTSACQKHLPRGEKQTVKLIKKMDFVAAVEKGETEHLCPACIETLKPKKIEAGFVPKVAFYSQGNMFGKVTLKSDGKISISINNSGWFKASDKFKFKKLGEEIVKADFNHPNVTKLLERNFKGLIEKLRASSVQLKEAFIEQTIIWAEKRFKKAVERKQWTEEDWFKDFNVEFEVVSRHGYTWYNPKNYKSEYYKSLKNSKIEDENLLNLGFEKYKYNEVYSAELHYENSLIKLADRLNEKGIKDETEFTIKEGKVGVNFNVEIEHNGVITIARTIIAQGPIQRPHYRYLVD